MNCNLLLLGDISFNGLISNNSVPNKKRFSEVSEKLSEYDFIIANLESPVKVEGENNVLKINNGVINIAKSTVIKDLLKMLNISAVTLANNHIYDQKDNGIKNTISLLNELGIGSTGARVDENNIRPLIFNLGKKRIGILSYVHESTNPEILDKSKVNIYNETEILQAINKLKNGVDYIVLSLHWGNDYSYYPTFLQVDDAKKFIDAGVKVIVGHHTHTMQPFEKYNNGYIFYSLGQLCYGDFFWEGKLGALKRKTKRAALPVFDKDLELIEFLTTKELKGNYIKIIKWNYEFWSKIHMGIAKLMFKYKIVKITINFKEAFLDRIFEYFFGYYRNPFFQFIKLFTNIKKIKYLRRDFKKYSNGD